MTWRVVCGVALAVAMGVVGASCAGSDDEIVLDLGPDGWTASGGPVDRGDLCPGGTMSLVGYLDLDDSPIPPGQGWEYRMDAIWTDPSEAVAQHREETQHLCADGSGWFTVIYEYDIDGPWRVIEGAGAYSELSGSGTVIPERGPWPGPGPEPEETPPGGWPIRTVATGTVEFAADG